MEKVYKNCQSCGMPLRHDEQGGGTNTDGTKSTVYCSHCYQQGQFTKPDLSVDEMKVLVKGKLKEFGFPGFVAAFLHATFQHWNGGKFPRVISKLSILKFSN